MTDSSRLVVGIDGSFGSRAAVERAAGMAVDLDVEVVAVHVLSKMGTWLSSLPDSSFGRTAEIAQELLDGLWTEPLRDRGARYRTRLQTGDPTARLLETARVEQALLVVVGQTGRGIQNGGGIGSTAFKLAQQRRCPVLIVPREASVAH